MGASIRPWHMSTLRRRHLAACLSCAMLLPAGAVAQWSASGIATGTEGVNYDPRVPLPPGSLGYSGATLSFVVSALFRGTPVQLSAATCGSGCRAKAAAAASAAGEFANVVDVVRFAKSGRATLADGTGMSWLVRMDERALSGLLLAPLAPDGQPEYPGVLDLSGRMRITVQLDGMPAPVTLVSREEPRLAGAIAGWPPYGMTLDLVAGPVAYYDERDVDDLTAEPLLVVTSNVVTLGGPSIFQTTAPTITEARVLGSGGDVTGVGLRWHDPAVGAAECTIDFFDLYRNATPGRLDGWSLVASLPVTETSYVDFSYDGRSAVEYSVIHATAFNFGYRYEGPVGMPVVVAAVPEPRAILLIAGGLAPLLGRTRRRRRAPRLEDAASGADGRAPAGAG